MAKAVNEAFNKFMSNCVNLDKDRVAIARENRDNLLSNIAEFNGDDFFNLYHNYDLHFGSFSRKTKCRPLDDIDLMIGIGAYGATYNSNDSWNDVKMYPSASNQTQIDCTDSNNGTLNSTLVLNKFKNKLEKLRDYSRSEVKRNKEAIVLNLVSKDWVFDIVPCFHTVQESDGRSYYLIPNGKGNWMKTDPTIDKKRIEELNKYHEGKMLPIIRIIKYWNKHARIIDIEGYVIECLLLQYFNGIFSYGGSTKEGFIVLMQYIISNINKPINDPKNIQGDLNYLDRNQRMNISLKVAHVLDKTIKAMNLEEKNDHKGAINIWRDIFGDEFPTYE